MLPGRGARSGARRDPNGLNRSGRQVGLKRIGAAAVTTAPNRLLTRKARPARHLPSPAARKRQQMTKPPRQPAETPQNAAHLAAAASRLNVGNDRCSRGWCAPDRAPRLRRAAAMLTLAAARAENPDRVRRLARDMRIRATELDLAGEYPPDFAQSTRLFRDLADPASPVTAG